jgi:lipoprotein-releasing system ATP-binding protein
MSSGDILSADKLTKSYHDGKRTLVVLNELSLKVDANDMLAIVGASGSGKSTLLHCLGGLDTINAGEICWGEKNIKKLSENKRATLRNQHLGFVYQFHHLLNEFTALENVCMPLLMRRGSVKKSKQQAIELLEHVGLADRATHKPGELSGGERQRVALARALVTQPKCVLADEPTGNLDRKTAGQMLELMLKLNHETGIAFVVVTHDQNIAAAMKKTLTLEDGALG